MRTLFEIIEEAKDGNMPTHDECYWAMLALEGLMNFDHHSLEQLAFEPNKFRTPKGEAEESFRRHKTANNVSPKQWLGSTFDPNDSAYQARRKWGKELIDKFFGEKYES